MDSAGPSQMRPLILILCLLAVTACDEQTPVGPTVTSNERFTLAPGEVATVRDVDLYVRFVAVTGDSRCPADALCIQGGDALCTSASSMTERRQRTNCTPVIPAGQR